MAQEVATQASKVTVGRQISQAKLHASLEFRDVCQEYLLL